MDNCALISDENNWRSTFTALDRQNIIRKLEEAKQKYRGLPIPGSGIEMENSLYENAPSRDSYLCQMNRLLLCFGEEMAVTQSSTEDLTSLSRMQNSTLQQSNNQLIATNFPQPSDQITFSQNQGIDMQAGVRVEMEKPIGSFLPSQMLSTTRQINISMPDDITLKKIITRHMIMDLLKHREDKHQLSLPSGSHYPTAVQNDLPDNQTTLAGPMRIKLCGVLHHSPFGDLMTIAQKTPTRLQPRRFRVPYQFLRQNANIRGGHTTIPSHNHKLTSVTLSNRLPIKDEQAYQDKVKELGRYIEPIKKMISTLGDGEIEKIVKLKRLLEILSWPNSPCARTTMEALYKIEVVLKKLDVKMAERQTRINEQNRLIDDISLSLQKTFI